MKKINFLSKMMVIAVLSCLTVIVACNEENAAMETAVPADAVAKLEKMYFDTSRAKVTTFMGETGIAVEDMFFTFEQIDEMASDNEGIIPTKHYRTNNLVKVNGGSREITMSVDPDLGQLGSDALDAAIDMFNAENLELTFRRVAFGGKGKRNKANIEVTEFYELESGGFITLGRAAGFPTRKGDPAKGFGINSRWFELSIAPTVAELAGTMVHEVGHCIGFRHTDYQTRESCGQNVNEGSAGVGAVYIPGTPTGSDANSIMQSCGPAITFNNNDRVALNYLY